MTMARHKLIAMTHVSDPEGYKVAAATLAVDAQIGQGPLPNSVLHPKPNPERLDVLELERGLLPDDLALVPRLAMDCDGNGSHDGLPSS